MAKLKRGKQYDDKGSFPIDSLDSFIAELGQRKVDSERLYFRGGGPSLVPHIGKKWYFGDLGPIELDEQEWKLLNRFRRFTNPDTNSDTASWETLFLARHHRLPTRLLDWSTNPLVALYFALGLSASNTKPEWTCSHCNRMNKTDPPEKYVWAISLCPEQERADIDVLARDSDPLKLPDIRLVRANRTSGRILATRDAIKVVFPVYNSARITAQRGIFTWQSKPKQPLESYLDKTLPDQNLDVSRLYRWSVPRDWSKRTHS